MKPYLQTNDTPLLRRRCPAIFPGHGRCYLRRGHGGKYHRVGHSHEWEEFPRLPEETVDAQNQPRVDRSHY